jgi:hypothetical protein
MKRPRGFIALMSAIIISTALLLISTTGSLTGFATRFNSLNTEFKERSYALAEACVAETLLKLANDPTYRAVPPAGQTAVYGNEKCLTKQFSDPSGGIYTFIVTASTSNATTNLQVKAKTLDLSITGLQQVSTY